MEDLKNKIDTLIRAGERIADQLRALRPEEYGTEKHRDLVREMEYTNRIITQAKVAIANIILAK